MPFTIVSGLPRSGTSLMMQMLHAGGLEPLTDNKRLADHSNPNGYYEWEPIKKLAQNPDMISEESLGGKCVKIVSPLLPHLPARHDYKIILMQRDLEEVMRSQQIMLNLSPEKQNSNLEMRFASQSAKIDLWLESRPNMQVLKVEHGLLIKQPSNEIERVRCFLGQECLPHPEAMAKAVDPLLYRNRKSKASFWFNRFFKTKPAT